MKTRKVLPGDWDTLAKTLEVSVDELKEVCPSLALIVCPPGTTIVREGEPGVDVYILTKGSLKVTRSKALFFNKQVARLKPGDLFGEVGFFVSDAGRTATVTAEGSAEVYRILAADMQALVERHADLRLRLEELARERVRALSDAVK